MKFLVVSKSTFSLTVFHMLFTDIYVYALIKSYHLFNHLWECLSHPGGKIMMLKTSIFSAYLSVTFIHNPCNLNLFSPHSPRFFFSPSSLKLRIFPFSFLPLSRFLKTSLLLQHLHYSVHSPLHPFLLNTERKSNITSKLITSWKLLYGANYAA